MDKLERYVQLLGKWSSVLNLVGSMERSDIWGRHIQDSLQLTTYIPDDANSFVDVGSGAGFPGIPLAIATGMYGHFVDSDKRKAAFLEVVISDLDLQARVWNNRAEAVRLPQQPLCTARAVAPLKKLVALCRPLMLPSATALFPKGRHYQEELAGMQSDPRMIVQAFPSVTDPQAAIVVMKFQTAGLVP